MALKPPPPRPEPKPAMQEIAKCGFKVGEKIIVPMPDRRPWWKRLLRIKAPEPKWFRITAVTDGSIGIANDD